MAQSPYIVSNAVLNSCTCPLSPVSGGVEGGGVGGVNPEAGLTLTQSLPIGGNIDTTTLSTTEPVVFACDLVGVGGSSGGLIFEFGGSGIGAYAGFRSNGDFIVRAGSGGVLPQAASISILDTSGVVSGGGTLVVSIGVTPNSSLRVWWGGVELTASPTGSGAAQWAGSNPGSYLTTSTGMDLPLGEVGTTITPTSASTLRYYENQIAAPATSSAPNGLGCTGLTCDPSSGTGPGGSGGAFSNGFSGGFSI